MKGSTRSRIHSLEPVGNSKDDALAPRVGVPICSKRHSEPHEPRMRQPTTADNRVNVWSHGATDPEEGFGGAFWLLPRYRPAKVLWRQLGTDTTRWKIEQVLRRDLMGFWRCVVWLWGREFLDGPTMILGFVGYYYVIRHAMRYLAILVVLLFATSGCSIATHFAIVNDSERAIRIEIDLFDWNPCDLGSIAELAIAPANQLQRRWFRSASPDWRPADSLSVAELPGCRFRTTIPPGMAIRFARVFNHPSPENSTNEAFAVQSVRWSDGETSQEMGVAELRDRFVSLGSRLYALFPAHAV